MGALSPEATSQHDVLSQCPWVKPLLFCLYYSKKMTALHTWARPDPAWASILARRSLSGTNRAEEFIIEGVGQLRIGQALKNVHIALKSWIWEVQVLTAGVSCLLAG